MFLGSILIGVQVFGKAKIYKPTLSGFKPLLARFEQLEIRPKDGFVSCVGMKIPYHLI